MITNELKFYFKKYRTFLLIFYLQTTLFFITLGTFTAFVQQLDYESNDLQKRYEGKAIYQLLDNYYDSTEYQEFIDETDSLNRLKNYYNDLNSSDDFQYLAMFNHSISVEDKGLPLKTADDGQGNQEKQAKNNDAIFTQKKSFQMNKQAQDFFGLTSSEGRLFTDQDFESPSNTMPALLGSSYKNVYSIGDEINIEHYYKPITIKIIGFIEENSRIYFNGNTEFFLDDHIIIPYINYDKPGSETDKTFQKISYLAMINGYVVTDDTPVETKYVLQKIDAIAIKNSIKYSFIDFNPHFLRYRSLMTVFQENKLLLESIFFSITVLYGIIINIVLLLQQKRRRLSFAIHYINGATKMQLVKMQWIEVSSVLFTSYLTSFLIINNILMIGSLKTQLYLLFMCIAMSIIVCIYPAYKLLLSPFVIYNEDEGENNTCYLSSQE